MIVQSTRISRMGGVHHLARHLLDKIGDNDRIEVLSGDRHALNDALALAKAKGSKYSIRHLSISAEYEMTALQLSAFVRSIDSEFGIGPDRPRLVVRHVKNGRSHFHLAVAEVDPVTLRVLDCRNDYPRLEALARRYELDHAETVQPSRAQRRQCQLQGFSDVARKRAERVIPQFDRTKLKMSYAHGIDAFLLEVRRQGLRITEGEKGSILVDASGEFVAAANRAVGVRRVEFNKYQEESKYDGNNFRIRDSENFGRIQHREIAASPGASGDARRSRSGCPVDGPSETDSRRPTSAGPSAQNRGRSTRPSLTPLVRRHRREHLFLCRLRTVDLDDLLRRAEEMAAWMRSIFEPQAQRLTRKIQELKQERGTIVPAEISKPAVATYDLKRRMRL